MLLQGLAEQLKLQAAITKLLATSSSIFMNVAVKGAAPSYLVLNLAGAPPAGSTLSGVSALIEGEIQIDSYAGDQVSARQLAKAVRAYLTQPLLSGALPDGTTIQLVDVSLDEDAGYELGGQGYVYRCMQRYPAFYTEAN